MPPVLAKAATWSACLIVVGVVVYFFAQIVIRLSLVTLPVAIALLLTALLFPLTRRLRDMGVRPIYATWVTMLVALTVLVGIGWLVGARASEEFPRLAGQITKTVTEARDWMITGPWHLREEQLNEWSQKIIDLVAKQQEALTSTVITAGQVAVEVLASLVLLIFVTFFLLKDGDRIWSWFLRAFGSVAPRVDRAGRAAWTTVSHYVQGTVAVAAIHGLIMGIVLAGLGVPLWAALAALIFLASFVPIVGIFFAGAVATLVTLGSVEPWKAVVFLVALLVEQQLENQVLQPLIVGRALNFHPLAIILVLAVGGVLGGIAGAVVAVPIAAVVYRAIPELLRETPALPPVPEARRGQPPARQSADQGE